MFLTFLPFEPLNFWNYRSASYKYNLFAVYLLIGHRVVHQIAPQVFLAVRFGAQCRAPEVFRSMVVVAPPTFL